MKIVFMGTPDFSVPALKKLAAKHEILAVYTQPDKPVGRGKKMRPTPVKAAALELGLTVFQPEKISQLDEIEKIRAMKPDLLVVVAFGHILKKALLDVPPKGCINIHSSLLPRWRGAAPIQWAILEGDEKSGVTTMFMAQKLDAGDILLQKETAISSDDTGGTLHDRLSEMGADLIVETLEKLEDGSLKPRVQDEQAVTYASKLSKDMEKIDPKRSFEEVDRQIRAFTPWPGTSVVFEDGRRLKIKKARPGATGKVVPPGELQEAQGVPTLGVKNGSIELVEVQWEGKKPVSGEGFLNGVRGGSQPLPFRVRSGH